MRILISNDDGYQAKGIKQLTKSLSEIAEVIVVAPSENKSAASSSLTLGRPLKPIQIEENIYAIDATPTDCVHLALCGFIEESIDLVVTGINFGANLGDDTIFWNCCWSNRRAFFRTSINCNVFSKLGG